jgi:hypothetical protein
MLSDDQIMLAASPSRAAHRREVRRASSAEREKDYQWAWVCEYDGMRRGRLGLLIRSTFRG